MELHLMRPEWLWLIVPAIALALLLWYQRDRTGSWQSVIAPHLLEHLVGEQEAGRSFNALPLLIAAWILAAVAASGPSWIKLPQPVHQKQDALVILLDLSYSMKSADLAPSRKDRARQKLLDLLDQRREGQTGLIAYAGDAHIVTPLTDDTHTIANLLPALNPDMMPVPGSNPASAVAQGIELLRSAGIAQGRLLLVTDEITERDVSQVSELTDGTGTQLSILSVGTATGAPIPLLRGGFLKDAQGNIVMPGVNEVPLRDLASRTGGRYMAMQIDDSDLAFLLAANPLNLDEQTIALDRTADAWEDQGYLLLIPLLPLVLAFFRRGWLVSLAPAAMLLSLVTTPQEAAAQTWDNLWQTPDQQGQAALNEGDIERAAKLFDDSRWAGTAAYRSGDYAGASQAFSDDASADGWYNRGNALAREGKLDEAIEAYRESLTLAPGREDAEHNLALLEKLKEQQEQQENQQQDQDQQNQDQSEQSSEDQQKPSDSQNQQQSSNPQDQQNDDAGNEQDSKEEQGQQQDSNDSAPDSPAGEQESQSGSDANEMEQEQPMALSPINPEELERDQAMEQWLRRVPDDPSGLLREKFRYESQLRQLEQQGNAQDNEKVW